MEFRTKYSNDSKKYISPSGDGYMNTYEYKYDDKGVKELVISGETNVKEAIQADYASTDINLLVARFQQGDTEALNQVQGFYGDITSMPKTYAELYKMMQEGENQFNALPVEVREMFNHSAAEFWSEAGSDEFYKKLDSFTSKFENKQFEVDSNEVGDKDA